jgi:catechol 2,3-dioxygenase-like lactoylglutathione lyase family enzyme
MIDHVTFEVKDYEKSKAFYRAALEPLGYSLLAEHEGRMGGFGSHGKPAFWIMTGGINPRSGAHVAFTAAKRADVDAFYRAAIAAGAKDNGAPGLRPIYHEHYYGAFVWDPDGNNVEAVTHKPER